jgi:two-component system phosphate regulon response regulator PhoB
MATILIVDDEPDIREVIRFALEGTGFRVLEAGHADEARKLMQAEEPDLVLLDWMLPGRSGLELAQQLKQNPKTRGVPIIMVSARGEEEDRIRGLETGADDYIAKPFSPREMVARVNAVLRRSRPEEPSEQIEIGGLRIDNVSHRVTAAGQRIEVAPTEFRLLHFLMSHAERAFTRSQLLDQVWGEQIYVEERTVDVHVRRLRKALETPATTTCCRRSEAWVTAFPTNSEGLSRRAERLSRPWVPCLQCAPEASPLVRTRGGTYNGPFFSQGLTPCVPPAFPCRPSRRPPRTRRWPAIG